MTSSPEQESPLRLARLSPERRLSVLHQRYSLRATNFTEVILERQLRNQLLSPWRFRRRAARRAYRSASRDDDSIRPNITSPSKPSNVADATQEPLSLSNSNTPLATGQYQNEQLDHASEDAKDPAAVTPSRFIFAEITPSKIRARIAALKAFAQNSVTKDTLGLRSRKRPAETSELELRASIGEQPTNYPRRLATLPKRAFVAWQNNYFGAVSSNRM